jgi:rRNA-processing protein FCF1
LVLLDTNALFLPLRGGFPLDAEVLRNCPDGTLAVPSSVIGELDRLVDRKEAGASAARALAERYRLVRSRGTGDDAILEVARRRHGWVVTADQELRGRLVMNGVTVLAPRDRHRLETFLPRPPAKQPGGRDPGSGKRLARRTRGNG